MMTPGRMLYLLRHNWKRGWQATWHDYVVAPRISSFDETALADFPEETTPVHLLTCRDDWLRACWTLASWCHFTRRRWPIRIHEDGTLPPEGAALFQRLFPDIRIITRKEADKRMNRTLGAFSQCRAYRDRLALALKVFDVPYFCDAERFILIDSDVLFFDQPSEILAWVHNPEPTQNLFNADIEDPSPLSPSEAMRKLRVQLVPKINSGIALLHRSAIDLPFCELALRDTSLSEAADWRIEQTLFALCSCRDNQAGLLPSTYEVSLGEDAAKGCIARHYVGAVRQRFYAEGLRRLQPILLPS